MNIIFEIKRLAGPVEVKPFLSVARIAARQVLPGRGGHVQNQICSLPTQGQFMKTDFTRKTPDKPAKAGTPNVRSPGFSRFWRTHAFMNWPCSPPLSGSKTLPNQQKSCNSLPPFLENNCDE
jgi:hypothetical protein